MGDLAQTSDVTVVFGLLAILLSLANVICQSAQYSFISRVENVLISIGKSLSI